MSRGKSRSMSGSAVSSSLRKRPRNSSLAIGSMCERPGEVTDDRGHRRAAAAAGRQQRARRVRPPHLDGDLARELQHVAVQEEEAGQAERVDHAQLLLQPRPRRGSMRVAGRVALLEAVRAQLRQRAIGLRVLRPGVAVAEVLREVEGQPPGQLARLRNRARVVLEARRHRRRGGQHVGEVAAARGLRRVQRGVVAQGDERVLQRRPRAAVRVDVAGRHRRQPEALGQLGEAAVARAVVAVEGALELHAQVVGAEDPPQPRQARLVMDALARAAAQADEPGGVLLERRERDDRRRVALVAVVCVRGRDDPAEVAPAGRVLDQQRDVAAVLQRHLRPVDRVQPEARGGLRELHRAAQAVVVGERERLVAERGRRPHQLVRERGPVEEGIGGVGMELSEHERMFAYRADAFANRAAGTSCANAVLGGATCIVPAVAPRQ